MWRQRQAQKRNSLLRGVDGLVNSLDVGRTWLEYRMRKRDWVCENEVEREGGWKGDGEDPRPSWQRGLESLVDVVRERERGRLMKNHQRGTETSHLLISSSPPPRTARTPRNRMELPSKTDRVDCINLHTTTWLQSCSAQLSVGRTNQRFRVVTRPPSLPVSLFFFPSAARGLNT